MIEIPSRGVIKITGTPIAKLIKENNFNKIKELYQQTSSNLMLIGGMIGLVIYAGLITLLSFVKDSEILLGYIGVWGLLVISKWVNQSVGINSHIINYSKFYRWNFYIMGFQTIINILLNYCLIIKYGLLGAALATAISILLNNILKSILVRRKFDMWPFDKKAIKVIMFLSIFLILMLTVPYSTSPFIDLCLRTSLFGTFMLIIAYKFNLSDLLSKTIESLVLSKTIKT